MSSNRRTGFLLAALIALLVVVAWRWLLPSLQRRNAPRLVYVSEMQERRRTGLAVRMTLNAHQYDQLQAMADTLIQGGYSFPSGTAQIHAYHAQGFGEVDDERVPEQWLTHLDRLREWNDARPASNLARIALAEGLIARAWAARGGGWAKDVSNPQWRRFGADIDEAAQILRQCPPEATSDPEWWEATLSVLYVSGQDSLYRVMSDSARRAFPDQWHLYNEMAMHLMPRWHGAPGDWERFATACATDLPSPLGDEVYARIVTHQSGLLPNVFHDGGGLTWERVKRGIEAWHRHFPESIRPRSAEALLAWEAGEREDARRAFASIGDTVEVDIWMATERYLRARKWAAGDDAMRASTTRW
jgi:uncharacterized protein DUF4034